MTTFRDTPHTFRISVSFVLLAGCIASSHAQLDFGETGLGIGKASRNPETGNLMVENCRVFAINDPVLSASAEGLLVEVPTPGDEVQEGDVIARLDDTEATMRLNTAFWEWSVEHQKTQSDVRLRYAEKEAAVSEAAYRDGVAANERSPLAISEFELRRRKLDAERGDLSIEKTREDMKIDETMAKVKLGQYYTAKALLERNDIKTPITGIVDEIRTEKGEWVRAGDPVVRVIRLDTLRVKGHVKLADMLPQDMEGRDVIIRVPIRRDENGATIEEAEITSKISFVSVNVESEEDFLVWADFENLENLAVRPGWPARMEILP